MLPQAIEQLHELLSEQAKVAEKITGVSAALGHVRQNLSTALAQQYLHTLQAGVEFREDLMKEEQTYERLLQALHDMQAQIEERVRPVAEQVIQAEVERLRQLSEDHRTALQDSLAHIDANILSCRSYVDQYHQKRSDLAAVNERLSRLGADPAPIPDGLPEQNLGDIIRARVEGLRMEGKI
jgi:DNA repair exonuclease SbcCD ATPase subunit